MTRWPPAAMAAWDVPTIKQNMNLNITWVLTFAYMCVGVRMNLYFLSQHYMTAHISVYVCMFAHVFVFLSQNYISLHDFSYFRVCVWVCFTFCLWVYRRVFMGEYVSVYMFLYLWVYLFLLVYLCLWLYMCLIVLQWDKVLIRRISRLLNTFENEQEKLAQDIQWDPCLLFYSRVTLYVSYFGANSTDPERWDLKAPE